MGIADELSGFTIRSSLPSSGTPTNVSRKGQVKLSRLAANSRSTQQIDPGYHADAVHIVANDEKATYGGSPMRRKRSLYRGLNVADAERFHVLPRKIEQLTHIGNTGSR
jgi:hypothetical protein